MSPVVFRQSAWRTLAMLAGCAVFVVAGWWMAQGGGPGRSAAGQVLGWISIAFFGAAGLLTLERWIRHGRLVIDAEGLHLHTGGTIPWHALGSTQTMRVRGSSLLLIRLLDRSATRGMGLNGVLSGLNRQLTHGFDMGIATAVLGVPVETIREAIESRRPPVAGPPSLVQRS